MSLQLYDLEPQYAGLADLLLQDGDQGAAMDPCQAVEAIRDEAAQKALSLAKVIKTLEAELEVIEEHVRVLQLKAQSRRERIAFLRNVVRLELEASGLDRVRDPLVTVWLQKSPPSVQVIDETAVPADFMRAVLRLPYSLVPAELRAHQQHLDVDRASILELVKRTGEVPEGVTINTGERHLRIR